MAVILIVAAHPDDEVLGCGATAALLAQQQHTVHVLFLADGVSARPDQPEVTSAALAARMAAAQQACQILGLQAPMFLGLPDNQLDTLPFLTIVQKVEAIISKLQPETIYTHHSGDLNLDHRLCMQAVLTACRPQPSHPVKNIYSFEVLSSTEWSFASIGPYFKPQRFVDVSKTMALKMQALHVYENEMRDFPHTRSYQALTSLAQLRGANVGVAAAEAFMVIRELVTS